MYMLVMHKKQLFILIGFTTESKFSRNETVYSLQSSRRMDNMEAELDLLIIEFSEPLCLYKLAAVPIYRLAANHSQDHSHPCSELGRWLTDWPVSGMPSHVPAYL